MIQYRVSAKPPEGECFMMEQFESRSDADVCYRGLQEDSEDNIVNVLPYRCVVLTFEEFLGGQWVMTNRKLVVR